MGSILYDYTPEEMQLLLDESTGYSDILRKVGLNPKGGNPETLKKIIKEYNLDETKLNKNRHELFSRCAKQTIETNVYSLEDILNNKHPKYQSSKLLKRLVAARIKEYRCEKCGIITWNNLPITLQLHHIDGNHENNNLDNLQILCPNCHSQTNTYAGKKLKNKEKNTREKKEAITPKQKKRRFRSAEKN